MAARAIVDTGFLVALLNAPDEHHAWARSQVSRLRGPWVTTEACISETVFLLQEAGTTAVERLFGWLDNGALISRHFLPEELQPIREETFRYASRWVDFADACIVRLSDLQPHLPVVTVDERDFAVYFRRRGGRVLLLPSGRAARRRHSGYKPKS